ncbi:MAG TPA: hypothetical protein VET85_09780 [Stellaceae bacterium]|nr:hypothetical protein [Stellaceae bacterium]
MDWNSIAKLAREAFRDAVNDWIGRARVQGGQVRGPDAILTPGSLVSDGDIEGTMVRKMSAAHAPAAISGAIARELAAAWNSWAAGFQAHVAGAYPSFAAFPGPVAPPTPAAPIALASGVSVGEAALKAPVLGAKLGAAVRRFAGGASGSADAAMTGLAEWVDNSFREWKSLTKLVGVMGRVNAPTFAPPYVPVAPVAVGDVASAGPVFAGPRFGKVVI